MSKRQLTKNRVRYCPSTKELSLEELVLSKTTLAVECSKEILRLTDMVKVLREDTQAMQAALISGDPLPFSSQSPGRRQNSPPAPLQPAVNELEKLRNLRKNADIMVRRMQGSMRFERPDLSEVLLGQIVDDCEKKSNKVGAGTQSLSQGRVRSDEYQVETEIKDRRGTGLQTEYQVKSRIIYSRWQTLKDLEKDNLADFAKIYDFKVRDSELNLEQETQELERIIFADDADIASDEDWDVSSTERQPLQTSAITSRKQGDVGDSELAKGAC